jgi:hypothetical protein
MGRILKGQGGNMMGIEDWDLGFGNSVLKNGKEVR